jgi:hypothetical protein
MAGLLVFGLLAVSPAQAGNDLKIGADVRIIAYEGVVEPTSHRVALTINCTGALKMRVGHGAVRWYYAGPFEDDASLVEAPPLGGLGYDEFEGSAHTFHSLPSRLAGARVFPIAYDLSCNDLEGGHAQIERLIGDTVYLPPQIDELFPYVSSADPERPGNWRRDAMPLGIPLHLNLLFRVAPGGPGETAVVGTLGKGYAPLCRIEAGADAELFVRPEANGATPSPGKTSIGKLINPDGIPSFVCPPVTVTEPGVRQVVLDTKDNDIPGQPLVARWARAVRAAGTYSETPQPYEE